MNAQLSSWLPISLSVPQGSNIGPVLFVLYVSDLPTHTFIERFSYNNGINPYNTLEELNKLQNLLNTNFHKVITDQNFSSDKRQPKNIHRLL
jgi:mannose/fructose/N-acetylgalactosamine-specific phosphotransferase system component IID